MDFISLYGLSKEDALKKAEEEGYKSVQVVEKKDDEQIVIYLNEYDQVEEIKVVALT